MTVAFGLACCGPAAAAPSHPGHAVLPGPLPAGRELQRLLLYPETLVELDRVRGPAVAGLLKRAGGELVSPPLQVWRVPTAAARHLLPALTHRRVVRSVTPDQPLDGDLWSGLFADLAEPLASSEWWIPHVGADRWKPPGPGVPLTVLDSGLDVSHEEFAGRPNTKTLNKQTFSEDESEEHGTAVSSVAAAPQNGVGIVGVYPRARLQSWDISPLGVPTIGDELQGLAAVTGKGRGVLNISFGGTTYFAVEEHAILAAFSTGSLPVVSAGNFREILSPQEYPASFAHVLTVAATDQNDAVTVFSSASPSVDIAAPGLDIPVAVPVSLQPEGYITAGGTSVSTPIVSGAVAAIWTQRPRLDRTQIFELVRTSARDLAPAGRDPDTGFGILNLPAAKTARAPGVDPQEPNEDIYLVKPNGISRVGHVPLTRPGRPQARFGARLDAADDPEDVYRVYLPARGRLTVTVKPSANVVVEVWGSLTRTVFERGSAQRRNLLAASAVAAQSTGKLVVRGGRLSRYVYLDVFPARRVPRAQYAVSLSTARP